MKKSLSILSLVLGAGLLTGCPNPYAPPTPPAGEDVVPSENLFFPDIPVPRHFVLSDKDSTGIRKGSFRFARLVYFGSTDPQRLVKFFDEQMPQFGWVRESEEISEGDGKRILVYRKSQPELNIQETARIEMTRDWDQTRLEVRVK